LWTITALPRPNYLLRYLGTENNKEQDLLDDTTSRSQNKEDEPIRCRTCSTPLTSKNQEISRQGRHEHVFFNPSGIAFEVRCFQDAPGCLVQGKPTTEFSWFIKYCWQYALCIQCSSHMGWFFTHSEKGQISNDCFFALIVREII
jgi:hypothetical protein